MPPPLTDRLAGFTELARLIRFVSRNTTITVISSWKCLRTPRSIFFRSEYLISLFFAASCRAAFTNALALPCIERKMKIDIFTVNHLDQENHAGEIISQRLPWSTLIFQFLMETGKQVGKSSSVKIHETCGIMNVVKSN